MFQLPLSSVKLLNFTPGTGDNSENGENSQKDGICNILNYLRGFEKFTK